jgi:molybdopterin/thiamine biosynthesis adenylyltransferase
MGLVLGLMAGLWGLGAVFRVPGRVRMVTVGTVWLAVVLAQLVQPEGAGLRVATGGRVEPWLVLGGVAALALGYRAMLGRIRARGVAAVPAPVQGAFAPVELDRYARHIILREVGGAGQKRLKAARVLVVGAGGLGSPVILYLAAAGVGTIGVVDDDVVENSNLQRQIIHTDDRLGMAKVASAALAARALNPFVEVVPHPLRLDEASARDLIGAYDLVLDGTDNFDTRYLVNRVCVALGKPLISAAITQWEGQIGLYDPARGGPCYECVFPVRPAPGLAPACAEAGVIAPLPGVVGSMMALEAVKRVTGAGETLQGRVMLFDGLHGETRTLSAKRRADCPVCGGTHA